MKHLEKCVVYMCGWMFSLGLLLLRTVQELFNNSEQGLSGLSHYSITQEAGQKREGTWISCY